MDYVWNMIVRYAPPILGVLILVVVALVVSGWIGRLVARLLTRAKVEKTLAGFFGTCARWGLMVLALIACLGVFGVETTSFAAVVGAAVLAIGLAFQGSLSNLAAGVMLLIFRPFKVGDFVKIGGELGKVDAITLFTTELDTPDNRRIVLPNASIFGSTIENITHHPTRRVDISVGVEYPADLDRTREVLTKAAEAVPGKLGDPPPQIILLSLGDSSVNWQVRVWTETGKYWDVLDAGTRAVKMALDEAGLGIPFPQMDVHLDAPAPQA
jgi:small conductance mechanosensitive channel